MPKGLRLRLMLGAIKKWFLSATYKADSVSPSLILDFANNRYAANSSAKNFSDILTFSRASTATYFDANGVLQTAAVDTPRFDYDPSTGTALGLLIEGSRTNIVLQSGDPQQPEWTASGATKTNTTGTLAGYFSSPVSVRSNGATWHRLQTLGMSVTSGTSYAWSVFIAAGTSGQCKVQMRYDGGGLESYVTGAVGSPLSTTSTAFGPITYVGHYAVSGGYIYYGTFTPNTTTLGRLGVGPNSGVAGDTVILYGAQLEAGTFPSSYIPTSGSAVTRSADLVSNSASNTVPFADWYNQSEGTVVAKFKGIGGDANYPRVYEISDGTTGNRHTINLALTTRNISLEILNGGAFQASRGSGFSGLAAAAAALAYKINNFAFSVNGDAPTTDTSGTPPTVTKLNIGSRYDNGDIYFGTIKELLFYPIRVTDSEMQRITT